MSDDGPNGGEGGERVFSGYRQFRHKSATVRPGAAYEAN